MAFENHPKWQVLSDSVALSYDFCTNTETYVGNNAKLPDLCSTECQQTNGPLRNLFANKDFNIKFWPSWKQFFWRKNPKILFALVMICLWKTSKLLKFESSYPSPFEIKQRAVKDWVWYSIHWALLQYLKVTRSGLCNPSYWDSGFEDGLRKEVFPVGCWCPCVTTPSSGSIINIPRDMG